MLIYAPVLITSLLIYPHPYTKFSNIRMIFSILISRTSSLIKPLSNNYLALTLVTIKKHNFIFSLCYNLYDWQLFSMMSGILHIAILLNTCSKN